MKNKGIYYGILCKYVFSILCILLFLFLQVFSNTAYAKRYRYVFDFGEAKIEYYIGTDDSGDDGKNEYTLDEFLGYGTDFEGIFHDDPTVKFYTILESDDIVVAIKKGEQIPFTRKLPFKE